MKILHVIHAYTPAIGGTEFLIQQVSEYLANTAGEEVTVFTTFAYNTTLFTDAKAPAVPAQREEETINGVKVKRFPVINRWGKALYFLQYIFYRLRLLGNGRLRMLYYGPISPAMKKAVKHFPADIIISSPFPLNHMNYVFKNKGKAPVVLVGCMHTEDQHGFKNPLVTRAIKRADGYIALTDHEKEYLVSRLGIPAAKIRVIGVGLKTASPVPGKKEIRTLLNIKKDDAPLIAFVGQHGLHKGIETLISAMPLVWRRFPGTRLVIAGGKTPFTDSFKKLSRFIADQNGGEEKIFFLDNVNEETKSAVLSGCDIFTTPSGMESFGITILEAWSRKKPVVACRISATMSLIQEYNTGLLVDYKDTGELGQALVELAADKELRKKIGKNGFKKWQADYSWEHVGNKYYDFYREVAGAHTL